MVQVLVNLVDNAVKYSPPDQPIFIRAREQGDELIVEVVDRGIGIPDEDLERVFDKFISFLEDQSLVYRDHEFSLYRVIVWLFVITKTKVIIR